MLCSVLETGKIRLIKSISRKPSISLMAISVARTCFLYSKNAFSREPRVRPEILLKPFGCEFGMLRIALTRMPHSKPVSYLYHISQRERRAVRTPVEIVKDF